MIKDTAHAAHPPTEKKIAPSGDPFSAIPPREEHTPCFHCLDTGWVVLTAENDFGELEDYFVLCRKCKG